MDGKSSSNRQVHLSGIELYHGDRCVGKVRLPLTRHDDFVADFNRIYSSIGMSLFPEIEVDAIDPEKDCGPHL